MDVSGFNVDIEGFTGIVRLAWVIVRTISKQISEVTAVGSTVEDDGILRLCLNRACDHDLFGFLRSRVFETATFQVFFNFLCAHSYTARSMLDIVVGIYYCIRPILLPSLRFYYLKSLSILLLLKRFKFHVLLVNLRVMLIH